MPAIRRRLWWVLLGLSIAIALLAAGDIVVGASFEPEGPPAIGGRILTAIATASPEASRVLDFRARMGGVSLLALGVLLAVLTWLHTGPASAGRGGRCACCPHGRSASSSSRCCMGWRLAKGSRRRCSQARSSRCSPEGPSFWTPDASSTRRGPAERRTATQLRCVADLVHGGNSWRARRDPGAHEQQRWLERPQDRCRRAHARASGDGDDDVAPLVVRLDVSVGLNNPLQRVHPVDDGPDRA